MPAIQEQFKSDTERSDPHAVISAWSRSGTCQAKFGAYGLGHPPSALTIEKALTQVDCPTCAQSSRTRILSSHSSSLSKQTSTSCRSGPTSQTPRLLSSAHPTHLPANVLNRAATVVIGVVTMVTSTATLIIMTCADTHLQSTSTKIAPPAVSSGFTSIMVTDKPLAHVTMAA